MQSTGQSTGYPQGNPDTIEEQLLLCVDCGAHVLQTSVRMMHGARARMELELLDLSTPEGEAVTYQLERGTGAAYDPKGAWVEHACRKQRRSRR